MRVYEINTYPWLTEMSERYGRSLTLANVPPHEWDALMPYRFDAVWLMGVWERSPLGRQIAQTHDGVLKSCAAALPGFNRATDVVGSPYSVHAYTVDERLGGPEALATAREELRRRGLRLILDYVPNHTARDHAWTREHPDYYVRGHADDHGRAPQRYFRAGDQVLAYGNGEWTDTAQLDAFSPGYRQAAAATLVDIGDQCDGVRCDMAYLLRSQQFATTWGARAAPRPAVEFWKEVVGAVRARHPGLLFIAESYGGSEWSLQQEGFDFCYDKDRLYDRMKTGTAEQVRQHLQGSSPRFLKHLIHFIENHDEDPADVAFPPKERQWQAAVAMATLPGASLWHYMQFEGRWGKQIVQLGVSVSVRRFYQRLLATTDRPAIRAGTWTLCSVGGSPHLLAWCWEKDDDRVLVVLNLSSTPNDNKAWGDVKVPMSALRGRSWKLRDLLSGEEWARAGDDMVEGRLHVGLPSWGYHLFEILPA